MLSIILTCVGFNILCDRIFFGEICSGRKDAESYKTSVDSVKCCAVGGNFDFFRFVCLCAERTVMGTDIPRRFCFSRMDVRNALLFDFAVAF